MGNSIAKDHKAGHRGRLRTRTRISDRTKGKTWDLSKIDFEKLKEDFNCAIHKNIEIADLRAFIAHHGQKWAA